jgi:hypothetical protein
MESAMVNYNARRENDLQGSGRSSVSKDTIQEMQDTQLA